MKWVTRDRVHLDRVAAPWLIRCFVDPEAEFIFLPTGNIGDLPSDAIPFGLPAVDLSSHDANGSTFRKIVDKYALDDPALKVMASVIEDGIAWFLAGHRGEERDVAGLSHPQAIGLEAISRGMMESGRSDLEILRDSHAIYDALHAWCALQFRMGATTTV